MKQSKQAFFCPMLFFMAAMSCKNEILIKPDPIIEKDSVLKQTTNNLEDTSLYFVETSVARSIPFSKKEFNFLKPFIDKYSVSKIESYPAKV